MPNATYALFPYIPCYCSTVYNVTFFDFGIKFPYIPCYCSTKVHFSYKHFQVSFHTSHVTVQPTYLRHFYFLSYHESLILQVFFIFCPTDCHFLNIQLQSSSIHTHTVICKLSTKNRLDKNPPNQAISANLYPYLSINNS